MFGISDPGIWLAYLLAFACLLFSIWFGITTWNKEDDEKTIEYISLFKDKGDYSLAIDANHYIWIVWNQDGSVWRGRLNKLGFKQQ